MCRERAVASAAAPLACDERHHCRRSPAPTSRDRAARRLVRLAVIALQRVVSTDAVAARGTVAAAMAKLFEDAPSAETIHHWERRAGADHTGRGEITRDHHHHHKGDPTAVVEHFLHLAHTILTPAPFSPPTD